MYVCSLCKHSATTHLPQVEYCINGSHIFPLPVTASVVPVTLEVSAEELHFEFSLDNWDTYIEKVCAPVGERHSFVMHAVYSGRER